MPGSSEKGAVAVPGGDAEKDPWAQWAAGKKSTEAEGRTAGFTRSLNSPPELSATDYESETDDEPWCHLQGTADIAGEPWCVQCGEPVVD